MKNFMSKRLFAYILDAFLIYLFILLVSGIRFINPTYDKLLEVTEKYSEAETSYQNGDMKDDEFIKVSTQYIYDANRYNVSTNIVFMLVVFAYYGLFQKFNNGQTLGKKIMKLRVVSKDNKPVSILRYIIRTLSMYLVFFGSVIPYLLGTILVFVLKPNLFSTIYSLLVYVFLIIGIIPLLMAHRRSDKKGLHDLIAGTKVIEENL